MTRLTEKQKPGDPQAYHPAIFDYETAGSGSSMKRSRPYRSSLDYKLGGLEDATMYVVPPRPVTPAASSTARGGGAAEAPRRVTTRARGSSGIPPQQLSLEDLQHLDEETLMRVLMENPHLAEEAERLTKEQMATKRRSSRSSSSTNSGSSSSGSGSNDSSSSKKKMDRAYHRRADGSVHQEDASYIEEMRKDGVPVVQWSVLLLLLGGLFYSLYAGSGKKKTRKTSTKAKGVVDSELEKVVAAIGLVEPETSKAAVNKKSKKAKPSATKPKTLTPAKVTKAPDRAATTSKSEPFDPAVPALVAQVDTAGDQAGWQVVGATLPKAAVDPAEAEPKKPIPQETPKESTASTKDTVESTTDTSTEHMNGSADLETAVDPNGKASAVEASAKSQTKKKKGKKSKPVTTEAVKDLSDRPKEASATPTEKESNESASSDGTAPTMDGDAALALELQEQEEKMADAPKKEAMPGDTTWEEVPQKKRRPKV
jgi:hypothetical protein